MNTRANGLSGHHPFISMMSIFVSGSDRTYLADVIYNLTGDESVFCTCLQVIRS